MATMREWLSTQIDDTTGLPLAKAGARGRFSRAATAAIADAISKGMDFDEPEVKAPSKPRQQRVVASTSTAVIARVQAPVDEAPKPVKVVAPKPRVRSESVAYGLSKVDPEKAYLSVHSVAFETCSKCTNKIGWCSCEDGPRCPKWLNGGEVASLTKP